MRKAITLFGMPALRSRFSDSRRLLPRPVGEGCEAALAFLEVKAKRILDIEIYQKARQPYDPAPSKNDPDALYQQFKREFRVLANAVVQGELKNTSPHALFIEFGTDDEGTGAHPVTAVNTAMLRWIDPRTGKVMFAPQVVVSGVKPTRFMLRAFRENRDAVRDILVMHVRRALDPLIGEAP